jgi:hypothetical protein
MADVEKRSVHTDALETLGTIITEKEKRDAIHLAVENTRAAVKLLPGQDVGVDGTANNPVGIVDPFLKSPVMPGEWFWLVVYPRQINSLRHVWTHPAFPDEPMIHNSTESKTTSEQWLRDFANNRDGCPEYETLVATAAAHEENGGNSLCFVDYMVYGEIPPEFWNHIEVVTGKKIKNRPTYFTCSC